MTRRSRQSLRRPLAAVAGLVALLLSSAPSKAATPEQVDAALERAKTFLYGKMDKDKFWELVPAPLVDEKGHNADLSYRQWGALTSLSTVALLSSGEKPLDPKFKPAVDWIKKQRLVGIRSIGTRAQIWPYLPPTPDHRQLAIKDRDYLLKGMHQAVVPGKKADPDRIGFYPYWFNDDPKKMQPGNPAAWDLTMSHYAVEGMWACEQVGGVEIPADYWATVDKAWRAAQTLTGPDAGSWPYARGTRKLENDLPRGTIVAAGVGTLFITQDFLSAYAKYDACKGGTSNGSIDAGVAWMDAHVEEMVNGESKEHFYYGLYGVERIGAASGKKYFGTVDWYEVGADHLVKAQAKDGSWGKSVQNTCFAMLFLSHGRAPVVMNKLEYALTDPANKAVRLPWAQRPRDVPNFTKFAARGSEQFFNWQVVNLGGTARGLADAPILYVAGSLPLDFADADVAKLRDYCEAGGTILFNADCGDASFVQSVVGPAGLGRKMFPKYEFRELPPTHPIFNDEVYQAKNWKNKPKVLGLSNGVRELAILAPDADLGRAWQSKAEKSKEEAFQLGVNLFYYAADKGHARARGDTSSIAVDPKAVPAVKLKVARVMVGDNPDPEPAAWRRLAAILMNSAKVAVAVEPVKLGENKLSFVPGGFGLAHLTGTGKFKLTPAQRLEVKAYVASGGTLFIDAAGGSAAFADAAEQELSAMFGGEPGAVGPVISPDEQPYNWPGFKIARFDYRQYAKARLSGKLNAPRVRGFDVAGKTRVFYSREDLTAGAVGQPSDGVVGYSPETATAIMRNVALYAAYNGRPPKPAPPAATNPAVPAAQAATAAK